MCAGRRSGRAECHSGNARPLTYTYIRFSERRWLYWALALRRVKHLLKPFLCFASFSFGRSSRFRAGCFLRSILFVLLCGGDCDPFAILVLTSPKGIDWIYPVNSCFEACYFERACLWALWGFVSHLFLAFGSFVACFIRICVGGGAPPGLSRVRGALSFPQECVWGFGGFPPAPSLVR